ncbi:hypothetical protein V8B97DRAFT_1331606 [Scleroderma yunnanense]
MMSGERKTCDAFMAGYCKYGDDCKFAHETDIETDKNGYLNVRPGAVVPADRDLVLCVSGASDRLDGGAQVQVRTPGRVISRPKTSMDRSTFLESSSTELLHIGSGEEKKMLHMPSRGVEEKFNFKGVSAAGAQKLSTSTFLPHRRTRSMVGPVSPSHIVSSIPPANFSAEF